MEKIGGSCELTQNVCENVKVSLVDFCEGNVEEKDMRIIKSHLELCSDCHKEYLWTKELLSKANDTSLDSSYFEKLSQKIDAQISTFSGYCEHAQGFIANIYSGDPIPEDISKHIKECENCRNELALTNNIMEQLHKLNVPMPNEKYFQQQLQRIDLAIEALPSHRVSRVENKDISSYFAGIFDSIKNTLLQPYAALAVSAMVIMLIVGGQMYSGKDSIEEKQINLSEIIRSTNVAVGTGDELNNFSVHQAKAISDPVEDEHMSIKNVGTAEKETENKLN